MDAYKFNIRIKDDGSIQLPYTVDLVNREAEIFIVPKVQRKITRTKVKKAQTFVKIWTGFISESTGSHSGSRTDFIKEKYK